MTTLISALVVSALVLFCLLLVILVTVLVWGLYEAFKSHPEREKRSEAMQADFERQKARVDQRLAANGQQTSGVVIDAPRFEAPYKDLDAKDIDRIADKVSKQMAVRVMMGLRDRQQ